jgi:hypothetical protein
MDFSQKNVMDILFQSYFAVNPTTGLPISSSHTLLSDGIGGIQWATPVAALSTYGASIGISTLNNLPAYMTSTTVTLVNLSTYTVNSFNTINNSLIELGVTPPSSNPGYTFISSFTLNSTIDALGTVGYISSTQLFSTVAGLGTAGYISSTQLFSTVAGLGTAGYISSTQLTYAIQTLGSLGYVSTSQMNASLNSLGTVGYISSASLFSTVAGLGTAGYISSASLFSTVAGLGTAGYISSASLFSTVAGLGTAGYISSATLASTLTSTFQACSSLVNVRFFTENLTGNVIVTGGSSAYFTGTTSPNLIYLSSFVLSSIAYTGTSGNTGSLADIAGTSITFNTGSANMYFSSFLFTPSLFTPCMNERSRVFLDVYPTYIFSRTSDNTTGIPFLTVSTMLQQGASLLPGVVHTAPFLPTNYTTALRNGAPIECCNVFQQPLRFQLSTGQLLATPGTPISLVHTIPGGFTRNLGINGLHSSTVQMKTPLTNSIYLTVHTPAL